jgi:hypothetical protein
MEYAMSSSVAAQTESSGGLIERALRIIRLLGPPPVLMTEDPGTFFSHRTYLLDFFEPRETAAVIAVERYARKLWEIARYDRMMAAIVRLARKDALRAILDDCLPDGLDGMTRDQLVEGWFTNPDTKKQILAQSEARHIGETAITAKATIMRLDPLSELATLREKAEANAGSLLREIAFYRSREEPFPSVSSSYG